MWRYGHKLSYSQIGKLMNHKVSKQRAFQIDKEAKEKIKRFILKHGDLPIGIISERCYTEY